MFLTFDDLKSKADVYRRVALLTLFCTITSGAITASLVQLLLGGDLGQSISGLQFLTYTTTISVGVPMVLCPIASMQMSLTRLDRDAARNELALIAQSDPLTGLLNRRGFDIRSRLLIGSSEGPLAILMCDIDLFKSINDRFGHEFGDVVLQHVAGVIRTLTDGHPAVACRRGGEEFAILLAGLSADAAVRLAETIRRTCAESPVEWNGMAAPVTISIGVAFSPALPIQLNALIVRADEALYDAKRMGRNRVCAATATVPTASAASAAATAITGWTASAVDANLLRYR